jgi:hypothetical protein
MQMLPQMPSEPRPQGSLKLLDRCLLHPADRPEFLQECRCAAGPDAGDIDEFGGEGAFRPALSMSADGEAVGLVPRLTEDEVSRVRRVEAQRL